MSLSRARNLFAYSHVMANSRLTLIVSYRAHAKARRMNPRRDWHSL